MAQLEITQRQAILLRHVIETHVQLGHPVGSKWLAENIADADAVRRAFQLCLGRDPSVGEAEKMAKLLGEGPAAAHREALEDLLWALMSSREFLFNH